jgi:hypothetical protein
MSLSTFAVRKTIHGWVIDATKTDGQVDQLIGVYTTKLSAVQWIASHSAAWWKLQND